MNAAFRVSVNLNFYWGNEGLRYTFNGKETDTETDLQDYGMRIYNPRLGKFLSVDPLTRSYPELTPYQFASNRPIDGIDLDGLEWQDIYGYGYASTYEQAEARGENGAAAVGSLVNLQFQGNLQGAAYGIALVASIPTGGSSMLVTFPLAMTTLGLETAKTIALIDDPNNQAALTAPSSGQEAVGMMGDALCEAATGEPTELGRKAMPLVTTIFTGASGGSSPEELIQFTYDLSTDLYDIYDDASKAQEANQNSPSVSPAQTDQGISNPAANPNAPEAAPAPTPIPAAIDNRNISQLQPQTVATAPAPKLNSIQQNTGRYSTSQAQPAPQASPDAVQQQQKGANSFTDKTMLQF